MTTSCPFLNATDGLKAMETKQYLENGNIQTLQEAQQVFDNQYKYTPQSKEGKCPMKLDQNKQVQDNNETQVPRCPYGYDQLNKNQLNQVVKLGNFNCPACKSFFIKAVRINSCQHIFCEGCLTQYKQCLLCGSDIDKIEELEGFQGEVESFLYKHSKISWIHNLLGLTKSQMTQELEELCPNRQSLFYLQLGQRSLFGGNSQSISRFEQSLKFIEDMEDSIQKYYGQSQLLGIVADLYVKQQEYNKAQSLYEHSLVASKKLEGNPDMALKIDDQKSRTLNKMGDVSMYMNAFQNSLQKYEQALQIRRDMLKNFNLCPFKNPDKGLDILISLVKLTDVANAMNNQELQNKYRAQAQQFADTLLKGDNVIIQQKVQGILQILVTYK